MKKIMLVAILLGGTLPLAGCFYPYDDGRGPPGYHDGYYHDGYDRVGEHGYYDHNHDTPDGYYR